MTIGSQRTVARHSSFPRLRSPQALAGVWVTSAIVVIALIGPLIAPHSPTDQFALPYSSPSSEAWLGTDNLGRDVLSRVLAGGLRIMFVTIVGTVGGYAIGISLGLAAGYSRGVLDSVIMRSLDVLMSFPSILLLLVLTAATGPGLPTVLAGVVLVKVSRIARVVRAATIDLVGRAFIEAAQIRGESTEAILRREILPNMVGVIVADFGPRLAGSFLLVAGLNYLGVGVDPPTPDWGAMIFENRSGLIIQPIAVLAPIVMIATLPVAVNLLGDAVARSMGRSVDIDALRR